MQVRLFPTRMLPSDLRPQGPPVFRNPASTNPRSQDEKVSALVGTANADGGGSKIPLEL